MVRKADIHSNFKSPDLTHIFFENKLIAKEYYVANEGYGSCETFIKTGTYKIPPNVQTILEKK